MEGKNSRQVPRALLIFGAPCSGKTTFSENFSQKFSIPFFDVATLAEKYSLNRRTVLLLVEQLAKTQSNMIIEGGIDSEADRDEMRAILKSAGYNPSLVWIQTDVGTIKARLKLKLKSATKAKTEYDQKVKNMEAPTENEAVIVLSGKHTFETQLKHVLHQLG